MAGTRCAIGVMADAAAACHCVVSAPLSDLLQAERTTVADKAIPAHPCRTPLSLVELFDMNGASGYGLK